MVRILTFGLLLCLLLASGHGRDTAEAAQGDPVSEIFQLVNQVRASRGLPPFQYNGALATAAQSHANWMAANLAYSHYGAGGSSPQSRATGAGYGGYVAENIVGGTSMSPRQGILWWQNSPVHYNTIVSSRYVEAGTGYASNGSQNMYVLVVGRPPGAEEVAPQNRTPDRSAVPLRITPIELAEPREDGSIVHVMRQGQAMWTVAAYYDVDLDFLYLINGLTEDDVLQPGDEVTVRLADGQVPPPTPTPPLTYQVQDGDTPWGIALINGIELDFLYLLNNLSPSSMLQPGDELVVRLAEGQAPPATPTPSSTHVVQEGQSIWLIAAIYNLTVDQLLALNDMTLDSVIRPGDELLIRELPPTPTATEPPAALPATAAATAIAVSLNPSVAPLQPTEVAPAQARPDTAMTPSAAPSSEGGGETALSRALLAVVVVSLAAGALFIAARYREG
jgi:LysM repeat protein